MFPSYGVAGILLAAAALAVAASGALQDVPDGGAGLFGVPVLGIVAGGAVLWLFYFVLRLIYPPGD